jgi:hypothetical protein
LTAIPEPSIEALKAQLSTLQGTTSFPVDLPFCVLLVIFLLTFPFRILGEKEQLIRDHRKALDTQEIFSRGLKDQLIQAALHHDKEMKDAQAAAAAKLDEFLEESTNSNAMLRAELEEESKARKAAEDWVALLTGEQKEYDQLVMQTDALALSKFFFFIFRLLLISLYLPVAYPYLFSLSCRALSGLAGARAEEGGRLLDCAAVQESGCALGSLRSPGCAFYPGPAHARGGPASC